MIFLLACADDVATPAPAGPLDRGWVARVAASPTAFHATVDRDRPGWTALHRNDWAAAWAAGPAARARAAAELATFHRVLADLQTEAWGGLVRAWSARGGLPAESALGIWAKMAGVGELGAVGAIQVPSPFGALSGEPGAWMIEHAAGEVWRAEGRVRGGDLAAVESLRELAAEPALREPIAGGARVLYDPLVHATLAEAYGRAATPVQGDEAELFSARLDDAGAPADALPALAISVPTETDDPDGCRATVAALDAHLDPWAGGLKEQEGGGLVDELRLVDGLRSRVLTALAVQALDRGHPGCAAALALDSLDATSARSVGPLNHPTAFAVLALASMRAGRVREALDALQPLMEPFPETTGAREVTGDLAVLLGMDRIGDSREN